MNILGISAFYYDSAACLVQDGRIVSAAQEERFTRKKHDFSFPRNAIDYVRRIDYIHRRFGGSPVYLYTFLKRWFMTYENSLVSVAQASITS